MADAPVRDMTQQPVPPGIGDAPVSFASVDIRAELDTRPHRPADYRAEDRALAALAAELADTPRNMLQKLAETALDLCGADTAGISLLETHGSVDVFRWEALAGVFAGMRNHTMPRDASPCGVCIDEDAMQLMYLADRCFPALRSDPRFVEALLIPFRHQGRPVGTIWIVTHRFDRKFDREDERLMRTLAAFASAGWQLWRANAELASLPTLLVNAQETERRQLARELRDDLCQKLAALSMKVSALAKPFPGQAEAKNRGISELAAQIGALADDVHRISHQLHPAILDDLGLEAALRDNCAALARRLAVPVRFQAEDVPASLPGDIALCLFRVAQGSLRNIERHAGASEVRVRLARSRSGLDLFIEDAGRGFEVDRAKAGGGLGLLGMRERLRAVGGDFRIRSEPGRGTEIAAHVPLAS
jgi:signal transduction histidine kinase